MSSETSALPPPLVVLQPDPAPTTPTTPTTPTNDIPPPSISEPNLDVLSLSARLEKLESVTATHLAYTEHLVTELKVLQEKSSQQETINQMLLEELRAQQQLQAAQAARSEQFEKETVEWLYYLYKHQHKQFDYINQTFLPPLARAFPEWIQSVIAKMPQPIEPFEPSETSPSQLTTTATLTTSTTSNNSTTEDQFTTSSSLTSIDIDSTPSIKSTSSTSGGHINITGPVAQDLLGINGYFDSQGGESDPTTPKGNFLTGKIGHHLNPHHRLDQIDESTSFRANISANASGNNGSISLKSHATHRRGSISAGAEDDEEEGQHYNFQFQSHQYRNDEDQSQTDLSQNTSPLTNQPRTYNANSSTMTDI